MLRYMYVACYVPSVETAKFKRLSSAFRRGGNSELGH